MFILVRVIAFPIVFILDIIVEVPYMVGSTSVWSWTDKVNWMASISIWVSSLNEIADTRELYIDIEIELIKDFQPKYPISQVEAQTIWSIAFIVWVP